MINEPFRIIIYCLQDVDSLTVQHQNPSSKIIRTAKKIKGGDVNGVEMLRESASLRPGTERSAYTHQSSPEADRATPSPFELRSEKEKKKDTC